MLEFRRSPLSGGLTETTDANVALSRACFLHGVLQGLSGQCNSTRRAFSGALSHSVTKIFPLRAECVALKVKFFFLAAQVVKNSNLISSVDVF